MASSPFLLHTGENAGHAHRKGCEKKFISCDQVFEGTRAQQDKTCLFICLLRCTESCKTCLFFVCCDVLRVAGNANGMN